MELLEADFANLAPCGRMPPHEYLAIIRDHPRL